MDKDKQELMRKVLALLAVLILAGIVGHVVSVISFNQREHKVKGPDDRKASYMQLADRDDSTSKWLKRDFDLYGKTVDLSAQTFDATFHNNSRYQISSWKVVIKIKGDCFINNAWCGTMEIHQNTGTDKEKVQTIDLRNYTLDEVELDYLYDGDLLIPLTKGDYVVYYPSQKDDEFPIKPSSDLTMGMIFYYLDSIDLSDYTVSYYYHKDFNEGAGFYAIAALAALWFIICLALVVATVSYKRAWKDMELRKNAISSMSVIYDGMYMIDPANDEMIPLSQSYDADMIMGRNDGAKKLLFEMLIPDADESYEELVRDFIDLKTLGSRLEKETIVCEYMSKTYGWRQIRFLAMDRGIDGELQRVIFTVQNINDEKLERERVEESIAHGEGAGKIELEEEEYSFTELTDQIREDAEKVLKGRDAELAVDISPGIPDRLTGCRSILRHAAGYLLVRTAECTESGRVLLSVYGKTTEGGVHLLISVRGGGNGGRRENELELADGLLELIGSELRIIEDEDGGRELYFETEQRAAAGGAQDGEK